MKTNGMMMKLVLAAAVLALIPATVGAAPAAEVAAMGATGDAVTWQPQIGSYDRLVLTVSGPDGVTRQEFKSGETPSFSLFDAAGFHRADGSYTWELRIVPRGLQTRSEDLSGMASMPIGLRPGASAEAFVQSGSFAIRDGALVGGGGSEPETSAASGAAGGGAAATGSQRAITAADQVILDDLIVDGSICVGLDCVNGESFGFDTIRLKENNLRIKFQDTSNSGSFPSNDWQFTANDSSNGGANYMAIDDVETGRHVFLVEAGAPNNALYVDDGGRVGLGTATPVVELHVVDGDTPTMRLEQDGSSGFTPQTWDLAGNETNFFVRDVTNGSKLPFKIFPNAPTNSLIVEGSTGDLGIGIQSPTAPVHVKRTNGTAKLLIEEAGTAAATAKTLLTLSNTGPSRIEFRDTAAQGPGATNIDWDFRTTSGDVFVITQPTSPSNDFQVNSAGNVTIRGTLTTASTTYPDYVFAPDYSLMPLNELREFVRANGHLPNIPTAEESAGKINVSELQVKLLEKVEELTLYTLTQQETIDELRSRLASLEEAGQKAN